MNPKWTGLKTIIFFIVVIFFGLGMSGLSGFYSRSQEIKTPQESYTFGEKVRPMPSGCFSTGTASIGWPISYLTKSYGCNYGVGTPETVTGFGSPILLFLLNALLWMGLLFIGYFAYRFVKKGTKREIK